MIFTSLVASVLLVASALVQALPVVPRDNDYWFSGFIRALDAAGCSTLSNLYIDYALTPQGPTLINLLKSQTLTILAPENSSFNSDHPTVDGDLFTWFTYNSIIGNLFSTNSTKRAPTESRDVAPTLMSKPSFSKRSNSNNQVQVIDTVTDGSQTTILIRGTTGSVQALAPTTYQGVTILPINGSTILPTKIDNVLTKPLIESAPNGFPKLTKALDNTGLMNTVDTANSITLFAPIDYAFEGYEWIDNDELAPILKNHVLSPTLFSPSFSSGSTVSTISNQTLKFAVEEGITYISCGFTKAAILRSDVVTNTGVVHVIDKLFVRCD